MTELDVRIVEVAPMRAASTWGFGESPEVEAWEKLEAWATPRGLLDDPERHPIYGFNNPNPSAGSPNYGYELWLQIDRGMQPDGDVRIVDFDGGFYAVTICEVPTGNFEVIGETWKRLVAWREESTYGCGNHQWLEKSVQIPQWGNLEAGFEFAMDLYLPISE